MERSLTDINNAVLQDAAGFIATTDAAYDARIEEVAAAIRDTAAQKPVVLLSGPSGSGKTTTARMIERKLDGWGFETHTLSMDDYFFPISPEQQKTLDLESPERVDTAFLNEQLRSIAAGEPTAIPRFDFATNRRTSSGWVLTRQPQEIVILEGIHALNPDVITLPADTTARVYVSVGTRLVAPTGDVLFAKRVRLLRRFLRDRRYRNRSVEDTLRMFDKVQRGENLYVMPFRDRADYDIDTFIPYEVNVYRHELWDDLQPLGGRADIRELLTVLEQTVPLSPSLVPPDALIREFVGGSAFG